PGGSYFFTVVTNRRFPLFQAPEAVRLFRSSLRRVMRERPFRIDAIVLLPDHLHCVWTLPTQDSDFSTRWRLVKYRFSLDWKARSNVARSALSKREKGIWQRRFWEHAIRDEEDLRRHVDYIHYNPVKHGFVSRPGDWAWSSFSRYVDRGVYAPDWGCAGTPVSIREMSPE
ncbi:MAG: transposase, partial [Ectothiorhodospiraceae bacterium]